MTGQIHTESRYLVHEGGTKFYETVVFHNADAKRFALVKRWGKTGATGGGEILVDTFTTARAAQAAGEKIIASKMKRGYQVAANTHGFHGSDGPFKTVEAFIAAVGKHYLVETSRRSVLAAMMLDNADVPEVTEENEVISEEPTPEPERDEDFGSW